MRFSRRDGHVPVPVSERWRQVFRTGEAELHGFTAGQLAAVSLQQDALPAEPGPVLESVSLPPDDPPATEVTAAADVAALERAGFVRPWPPAPPDGPIQEELAGWVTSPDEGRRKVAVAGDLAIIAATRSRPAWIAEVTGAADPGWPDPDDTDWGLIARIYARYTPPAGLLERPAGPDGTGARYVMLRDDRVLATLVAWCAAGPPPPASGRPVPGEGSETDTAELAARFTRLTRVSVALPDGGQVRLRNLIVAAGDGGQWLLEGRYWERATGVSADGIGARLSAIVKSASAS